MRGLRLLGLVAATTLGATSLQAGGTMSKLKKAVTGGGWCCYVENKVSSEGGNDLCVPGTDQPKEGTKNKIHAKFLETCGKLKGEIKKKEG